MVVFGSANASALDRCRAAFSTPAYRVAPTDDIVGVEIAAAMKNAYAIALGVADGLERITGMPHHNLRAALFPLAVREMGTLAEGLGGRRETVDGLAGSGDLQVTITSGRNRLLGERIGSGESAEFAAQTLAASGTTVEGYPAVGFGHRLAECLIADGTATADEFSLLIALQHIFTTAVPPLAALWAAAG